MLTSIISPQVLAELIQAQPDVRLLDVRTPGEFESAHISGAYNVPLDTLPEHTREIRTVTEAQIVLVCQSGQRAGKAEDALRAAGMSNLHVLEGGVNAWIAAGYEIARGRKRISLERQVRIAAGALAATGGLLALFVNPLFAAIPAAIGSGLVFAGLTDTCLMGMMLSRLGYNRPASCDPAAAVRMLTSGVAPRAILGNS
jgi:rhodanese-related sulfurtransferase